MKWRKVRGDSQGRNSRSRNRSSERKEEREEVSGAKEVVIAHVFGR